MTDPLKERRVVGDVPLVCERSGVVMILDFILVLDRTDLKQSEETIQKVAENILVDTRIRGRMCPGCRFQSSDDLHPLLKKDTLCTYRPLHGPLFVPRG